VILTDPGPSVVRPYAGPVPRPALRVLSALVAALAGGALLVSPTAAQAAPTTDKPVVLVGVTGLTWDDVSTLGTPALWSASRTTTVGLVSARSVTTTSCPADGWLAVSTGSWAADLRATDRTCRTLRDPGSSGIVPGWADYLDATAAQPYSARPGALGELLADAGVTATGIGPGAAIALAAPDGTPVGTHVPDWVATDLRSTVRTALTESDLVVVDLGTVRDSGHATVPRPSSEPSPEPGTEAATDPGPDEVEPSEALSEPTRAEQVRALDDRLSEVVRAIGVRDATVILVSLADSGRAQLQLGAMWNPAEPSATPGYLTSGSTRQTALVQGTDVAPSLMRALGLTSPAEFSGAAIRETAGPASASARMAELHSIARHAVYVTRVSAPFTTRLVLTLAVLFVVAAIVLRVRRSGRATRVGLHALRIVSIVLAAAPVASFLTGLVPWWSSSTPRTAFWFTVGGFILLIAATALLGPWRNTVLGPAGVVAAVTVLTLCIDLSTGSHLVVDSPMGAHRILAARFYGASNQAFALLVAAGVLLAVVVAHELERRGRRRAAVASVIGIGAVILVVDGTPGLGSDFGGPPSILLAFTLLAFAVAHTRVQWRTLLIIAVAGALVVGGLSVLDWMRPPNERTHLGRFVATVLDGGLWQVVYRKLSVNLRVLTSWRYLLVAVAGIGLTTVLLAGPHPRRASWLGAGSPMAGLQEAVPLLRPAVAATGLALFIGFAVNDSGIVVPATGIAVAVPCLVAAAAGWRLGARASTAD